MALPGSYSNGGSHHNDLDRMLTDLGIKISAAEQQVQATAASNGSKGGAPPSTNNNLMTQSVLVMQQKPCDISAVLPQVWLLFTIRICVKPNLHMSGNGNRRRQEMNQK